jgi:ligand-binding sensor domain-containing protein
MCFLRWTLLSSAFVLSSLAGITQKHNFIAYNIDEGLPQSEVFNILQDNDRHIWLATGGGVSRFDGKTFSNYTS